MDADDQYEAECERREQINEQARNIKWDEWGQYTFLAEFEALREALKTAWLPYIQARNEVNKQFNRITTDRWKHKNIVDHPEWYEFDGLDENAIARFLWTNYDGDRFVETIHISLLSDTTSIPHWNKEAAEYKAQADAAAATKAQRELEAKERTERVIYDVLREKYG